jgi:hypothetical protein
MWEPPNAGRHPAQFCIRASENRRADGRINPRRRSPLWREDGLGAGSPGELRDLARRAKGSGFSIRQLALGVPLHVPGVYGLTVGVRSVEELRAASIAERLLNPDAHLMRSFIDLTGSD